MKKINRMGFMLAETLLVTAFVAGVLIYAFIQFTNLNKNYEYSYMYNSINELYLLEDVKDYILSDNNSLEKIKSGLISSDYVELNDCSIFTDKEYCKKLFDIINIDNIIVANNYIKNDVTYHDEDFTTFIHKINGSGDSEYRLIASFKNSTYATLRFGD